jgi:magnesium-dependent phosphatase 1
MTTNNDNNKTFDLLPKVVVFDLDGTIWRPELFQLNGGSPFSPKNTSNNSNNLDVEDSQGNEVNLIGDIRYVFHFLHNANPPPPKIAISSSTDCPEWAKEILSKITIENKPLESYIDHIEMSKDSKLNHLEHIRDKFNVSFDDMLFFDNEYPHVELVSKLGVESIHTPREGMSKQLFEQALDRFGQNRRHDDE